VHRINLIDFKTRSFRSGENKAEQIAIEGFPPKEEDALEELEELHE
jgi:hypothetical protein